MDNGADCLPLARIKLIGVGGGGCNTVDRLCQDKAPGVQFLAVNTDAQALMRCQAPTRIRIGDRLTRGMGAGGDPGRGYQAAEESRGLLVEALREAEMVFLIAGMGGGTGTGASPMVAEVAKEGGALTVAVGFMPFDFEGEDRRTIADEGVLRLRKKVDNIMLVPNDRLYSLDKNITHVSEAFRVADRMVWQMVKGVADLVTTPGEINLDFADVRAIMVDSGPVLITEGMGSGEDRAVNAARAALSSPLLGLSIEGSKKVLLNITGDKDLKLQEVNEACSVIREVVDPKAKIIFGVTYNSRMATEVKINLIATGFPEPLPRPRPKAGRAQEAIPLHLWGNHEADLPPFLRPASQSS